MAPEEGEPVEVDIALDGEPGQLPEEALTEVQRLLAPQHLVTQQQPQRGDVGTGPGVTAVMTLMFKCKTFSIPGDVDNL